MAACYRGLDPFLRLAGSFEASQLLEGADGLACSCPSIPLASLFNATIFDRARPQSLAVMLDSVWPIWERSSAMRWAAWIVEGDSEAEAIAAARGMSVDSRPRAMGAAIDDFDLSASTETVTEVWDMATAASVNERAYGLPSGLFGAAASAEQPVGTRCFISFVGERPAATVISFPNTEDCMIAWVASDPALAAKGHARAAMTAALKAAQLDGFQSSTLQSSAAGVPLYLRLGYHDLGRAVNLWQYTRYA